MKNKLLLFLFIIFLVSGIYFLFTPGFSESAEIQTLEIDFSFTAPDYPDKQLLGYILYREGEQVCQTDDPGANTIACDILTEDGTFNFTLTGYYSDDTESPPSPTFPFTIDSTSVIPPETAVLHTLEIEFAFIAPNYPDKQMAGYILYKESEQVCQTDNPTATTITCDILTEDGIFNFTLTGYYTDGTESPPSPSFPFTIDSTSITQPDPDPLLAVINPTPSSGEVPLNISFAGTGSTGNIAIYYWEFGDGTSSTGSVASHTYSIPGTYTATLRVEDESGAANLATTIITALQDTTPPEPPTAVLSSTTAAGNAPLPVTFSGSSSTTPNPPIVSYSWAFGDGSQATGATTTHTYSTAGTYHTELTVTDSLGLTDKVDTPVVVLVSVTPNEKPVAIISADPTEGDAPLIVTFDGSQSSDPDGSIARYDWNFGDGTTATGPTATHTYTDAAIYTMSLQITDDLGETTTVTREIICNIPPPENILNFEVGEIGIDHQWVTVLFENSFIQPVVIAGPPSTTDSEQVLVRISNINQDGFDIRLQEWDYLDDIHTTETFSYIVMEDGIHTLDTGLKIEAGSFTAATRFQKVSLQQSYNTTPVILTQVITENEADAVTGRVQNIGRTIFEYKLQEQETTKSKHTTETVGYIAWEPGKGEIQGLLFETGLTPENVTSNWFDLAFQTVFPDLPLFIADMQTYEGRDTAVIRTQNITQTGTQIKIEEEQSKDNEIDHPAEVTGYLVIGGTTAATE